MGKKKAKQQDVDITKGIKKRQQHQQQQQTTPQNAVKKLLVLPGAAAVLLDDAARQKRQERFTAQAQSSSSSQGSADKHNLEKSYMRLTASPDVSKARPLHVLTEVLKMVKQRWVQESEYAWACDQLKCIRQELSIQNVQSALTVEVYETHARIALEAYDTAEFNQCQTALRGLYKRHVSKNRMEFAAYELLYAALQGRFELSLAMRSLKTEAWQHAYIQHAIKVCRSRHMHDARSFAKLFQDPVCRLTMSAYLMDLLQKKLRNAAFTAVHAAFRPAPQPPVLAPLLGFSSTAEAAEYVQQRGMMAEAPAKPVS